MQSPAPEKLRDYPVRIRRIAVGDLRLDLLGPANYESLVDDPRVIDRFKQDEYMPYWAEFWPACMLLAEVVAEWPSIDATHSPRPSVLELGCGLGLASLVAAARGYRVIASDYDDDALAFVRESAILNGLPPPETRFVDWRDTHADLRLDRIMAAEVLYETRNLRPIAEFVRTHLSPGGEAIIVDGNRRVADDFERVAVHCGLRVTCSSVESTTPEPAKAVQGRLFRLTHLT